MHTPPINELLQITDATTRLGKQITQRSIECQQQLKLRLAAIELKIEGLLATGLT